MTQPPPATNWRLIAGVSLLILSCLLPLCALVVPLLGLSVAESALVGGMLVAGAPEILILIAIALLGRQNFDRIVGAAKKFFFTTFFSTPVSRTRYYVGLAISILSFVPLYVAGYASSWMPPGDARIFVLASADLAFVLSVFIMGGEFWEKFRRLFVWEGRI